MSRVGRCRMAPMNGRSYFLVTGGSGGIGSALCRLLTTIGHTPIIGFNQNRSKANILAKETGGFSVQLDMRKHDSIDDAIKTIQQNLQENDESK